MSISLSAGSAVTGGASTAAATSRSPRTNSSLAASRNSAAATPNARNNFRSGGCPGHRLITYPRHFFEVDSGKIPELPEKTFQFWSFRRQKPDVEGGEVDTEPFNGHRMREEMISIKRELRRFASNAYDSRVRELAKVHGLVMQSQGNQYPVTHHDIKIAASDLMEPTIENVALFYNVFYSGCDRRWTASVVDNWMTSINAKLAPHPEPKEGEKKPRKHSFGYERGGFSNVAATAINYQRGEYIKATMKGGNWAVNKSSPKRMTRGEQDAGFCRRNEVLYEKFTLNSVQDAGRKIVVWVQKKVSLFIVIFHCLILLRYN